MLVYCCTFCSNLYRSNKRSYNVTIKGRSISSVSLPNKSMFCLSVIKSVNFLMCNHSELNADKRSSQKNTVILQGKCDRKNSKLVQEDKIKVAK